MDFFNKLSKKASETAKGVGDKTSKIAKEAKLRMKMNDDKSKINALYQEIGKKVYERHTTNGEISIKTDLEEECTKIDVLTAEIETCLNEIRLLNDKKQCVKCFAEIEKDAKFCVKCGAEQPAVEEPSTEKEAEIVATNESVNEEIVENIDTEVVEPIAETETVENSENESSEQ